MHSVDDIAWSDGEQLRDQPRTRIVMCDHCGAAIIDRQLHLEFHQQLDTK